MAADAKNLSGAEEYVSLALEIGEPIAPATEKNVRDAVAKADGVLPDSLHVSEKAITLCYDPARITKEELTNLLEQAGVQAKTTETDRAPFF
jgi:hypothetical protein